MIKGSIIYKKFKRYKPLNEMKGLQWFALTDDYGTEYGSITKKYKFKKDPKLLDIGDGNVREMIENFIKPHNLKIMEYSDPDEQYSGGVGNKNYHNLVQQYFGQEYDGTIINSNDLKESPKYSKETLEGATEIVLWKDFTELLEEVDENIVTGGRRPNRSKKSKKSKKNRKSKKNKKRRKNTKRRK